MLTPPKDLRPQYNPYKNEQTRFWCIEEVHQKKTTPCHMRILNQRYAAIWFIGRRHQPTMVSWENVSIQDVSLPKMNRPPLKIGHRPSRKEGTVSFQGQVVNCRGTQGMWWRGPTQKVKIGSWKVSNRKSGFLAWDPVKTKQYFPWFILTAG